MDFYRTIGVTAGTVGIVILAVAWMTAPAVLTEFDPTIIGYSRNTFLLVAAGLIAIIAGTASYIMARPIS